MKDCRLWCNFHCRVALTSGSIHLTTLHIGDNNFTAAGLVALCEYLPDDTSLTSLFLCDNLLEVEGTEVLGQALIANNSLELLSLAHCGLTDESLGPLLASLAVNERLQSLHLWGNELSDQSCVLLNETLRKHNHSITDILLFSNPISEGPLEELSSLLNQNKSLALIDHMQGETAEAEQTEQELAEIIHNAALQGGIAEVDVELEESQA